MKGVRRCYEPNTLVVADLECLQCGAGFVAVWYALGDNSGDEGRLAVLPRFGRGGVSMPATPDGVAYYLTQASLSQSVGALSAAVGMYRAAVEQILLDQGYTRPMLGPKLADLETDIQARKG